MGEAPAASVEAILARNAEIIYILDGTHLSSVFSCTFALMALQLRRW